MSNVVAVQFTLVLSDEERAALDWWTTTMQPDRKFELRTVAVAATNQALSTLVSMHADKLRNEQRMAEARKFFRVEG